MADVPYALHLELGSANPPPKPRLGKLAEAAARAGVVLPPLPIVNEAARQAARAEDRRRMAAALERAEVTGIPIDQHRRPDCICRVGVAERFGAKHATACPRFAELHDVDVARADHLAGKGWHVAWVSACSCGAISAGGYRTAGEARRALEDTRP